MRYGYESLIAEVVCCEDCGANWQRGEHTEDCILCMEQSEQSSRPRRCPTCKIRCLDAADTCANCDW